MLLKVFTVCFLFPTAVQGQGYGEPPPPVATTNAAAINNNQFFSTSEETTDIGFTPPAPDGPTQSFPPEADTTLGTTEEVEVMVDFTQPPPPPENYPPQKKQRVFAGVKSSDNLELASIKRKEEQSTVPFPKLPDIPALVARTPIPINPKECRDEDRFCAQWAKNELCSSVWMLLHCQKACECCGCSLEDIFNSQFENPCEDRMQECKAWAKAGECEKNVGLEFYCRASCHIC